MLARRLVTFLALPAVMFLETFAWYGVRAVTYVYLFDQAGYDYSVISSWWWVSSVARGGGYLLGGLVAAVLGPNVALSLGALLLAAAVGTAGLVPYEMVLPMMALGGIGSGAAMTGLWTSAASAFARPAHQLRNALFLALYAVIQVGAASGSGLATFVSEAVGFLPWFLVCGATALVGALVAAVVAGSHWLLPKVPPEDPSQRLSWPPLAVSAALIVLALLPWSAWWLVANRSTTQWYAGGLMPGLDFYLWVNPAIVLAASLAGMVVAVGLHLAKVDVPALLWVGAGFGIGAVGGAVAAASALGSWPWGHLAAMALMAAGEALVTALLLSRIAGDFHWRLSALMVGGWLTLGAFVLPVSSFLADLVSLPAVDSMILMGCAGLLGGFGFLLLIAAFPVQWWVIARIDPEPDAQPVAATSE